MDEREYDEDYQNRNENQEDIFSGPEDGSFEELYIDTDGAAEEEFENEPEGAYDFDTDDAYETDNEDIDDSDAEDSDFDHSELDQSVLDHTDEFYDEEDERAIYGSSDDAEKEYTVSTLGFFEQYGDEIKASVREVDEDDIYSEYEEKDEQIEEGEYKFPKKKRKKKHYLFKFCILLVVACAVFAVAMSPLFNIKTINVEGGHKYKPEQIIAASGVKTGRNIFRVRESEVEKALKKDAYFSAVSISRKLPGTLTIRVIERKEAAYIEYGDSKIVIDPSGFVLRKTEKRLKLTELQNLKIKSMEIGEKLQVSQDVTFNKTLEVLDLMEDADIFFKKIYIKKVILKAYINNRFLVKGKPDNIIKNMKNGNLKSVIKDLRKKGKHKGTITLADDNYCSYSPKVH